MITLIRRTVFRVPMVIWVTIDQQTNYINSVMASNLTGKSLQLLLTILIKTKLEIQEWKTIISIIIQIEQENRLSLHLKIEKILGKDKEEMPLEDRPSMSAKTINKDKNKNLVQMIKLFSNRTKAIDSLSQELYLGKQMPTLKSRCIEMRKSKIIYNQTRGKTWIWCSMTLINHLVNNNRVALSKTTTRVPMGKDKTIKHRETECQLGRDAIEVHIKI